MSNEFIRPEQLLKEATELARRYGLKAGDFFPPPEEPTRQAKWDQRWLRIAAEIATHSKDPSTQVGAVLTRDNRVISTGFNGFPRHIHDVTHLLECREEKYKRIVHAEANCLYNAKCDLEGCTLYVTHSPCNQCALALIQSGIVEVVHYSSQLPESWTDSTTLGRQLLVEAGVAIRDYERATDAAESLESSP